MEKENKKNNNIFCYYTMGIFLIGVLITIVYYSNFFKEKMDKNLKSEITLEELKNVYNFKNYIETKLNNGIQFSFQESRCMIFICSNYSDATPFALDKESLKNLDIYLKNTEFNIKEDYYNLQNKIKEEEIKSIELKKKELKTLIKN